MKLNPECVRDTLIYLEDNLVMCEYFSIKGISFKTIINELSQDNKYSEEDVAYTLTQLMSAGYITGYKNYNWKDRKLSGHVDDISWSGHNFINTVRPETIWNATKKSAKKMGVASIHGIMSLASTIFNAIINDPEYISAIINNIPK